MSYTVRPGDTLFAIAAKHHVSLSALENANKQIANVNVIQVGEKIHLPGQKDTFQHGKGGSQGGSQSAHRPSDPVKRLNQDLSQMQHAKKSQTRDAAHEKKANASLKGDQTAKQQALSTIDQKKQALEQQILQSQQPTTPGAPVTPPPADLLQQLQQLGKQRVQTQDRFDAKLSNDRKAIRQDGRAVTQDQKAYKTAHQHGLKDLKPAEYHLGLKQTNQDRKALGLKPLTKALRPEIKNVVGGKVGSWIAQAQAILKAHGVPLSKMNPHDIDIIIQHESSGNPRAINLTDSNAAAGHPSKGLMQTIGPTFDSYKLPGHNNIYNPVDNIIAGVRYAISRYGSISNVPGVRAVHSGGSYVGY